MNRKLLPALVAAALATLCASAASAQTVGELLGSAQLQFESEDGEPLVISKYDTDVDDGTYVPLCTTPCSFQLPAGSYDLMAGDHQTFSVVADGGIQRWLVDDKSVGGVVAGAVLTGLGPGLPLVVLLFRGLIYVISILPCAYNESNDACDFFNDDMNLALIVTGAVGGAMLVTGISLLSTSFGTAELISSTSGTVGLGSGLRLAPGLFAYENPSGGHNLGLGLSLRF
jgi:hypothetical protein